MSDGTWDALLIQNVMSKIGELYENAAIHDRNTSPEKSSSFQTISVYTPDALNTHEASEINVMESQLFIRYTGDDNENSVQHRKQLAYIEDEIMKLIDQEIADPSGTNYKAHHVSFDGKATSDEENQTRLDSILRFNFRYEYQRGAASVI